MKSPVYLARTHSNDPAQRIAALEKLLRALDPFSGYKKDELVPIKLTIGDSSCVHHLSPELARIIASAVKEKGAKPFFFDTSVIYPGQRQNAVDHLQLAESKGFGQAGVGAPFIVADGLLGQDGREYALSANEIGKIKIPAFIGMLDSLVVLSHATGHIVAGYAGAIKNVAMGMCCRPTKQVQHSSLKPSVIGKKCTACGCCIRVCPADAISLKEEKAWIDQKACIGCAECLCACRFDAVSLNWKEDPHLFCRRMVTVADFILSRFRNKFFLNFAFDITKECDCISAKGEKIVAADLGIIASHDILSLDKATMDLVNEGDTSAFFKGVKDIYGRMFESAAQAGLGNPEYDLVEL